MLKFVFGLLFLMLSQISLAQAESEFYCQGELPGYGYAVAVESPTKLSILSVTSTGRFELNEDLPQTDKLVTFQGELIGRMHRWSEYRHIQVSRSLLSGGNGEIRLSDIPFYCKPISEFESIPLWILEQNR